MSLRTDMLQAVANNPGATVEEIAESLGEAKQKRVRDNLIHARNDGHVSMARDEITGLPGYTITEKGRERLNTDIDQPGGPRTAAKAQPAVAQNTGSRESDQDLLADVAAVHETPSGEPAVVSPTTAAGRADDADLRLKSLPPSRLHVQMPAVKSPRSSADDMAERIGVLEAQLREQQGISEQQKLFMRRISAMFGGMAFPEVIDEVSRLVFEPGKQPAQEDAVEITDAATAYLVRVPKRKPRLITKPASARDAALAAVRNGAPVATVFALVPVGTARRGAEWTDKQ